MKRSATQTTQKGFKVWQLVLTVGVMGLTMRLALSAVPAPGPGLTQHSPVIMPARQFGPRHPVNDECPDAEPVVEVLPFNLRGEVPGPLLADILQRYLPESTADQASDLRDTLPPGTDPRMIVILPEERTPGYY